MLARPHRHLSLTFALTAAIAVSQLAYAEQRDEHEHVPSTGGVVLDAPTVRHRAETLGPGVAPARVAQSAAERTRQAVSVPLTHPPRLEVDVGRRVGNMNGVELTARVWQDVSLGGYGRARAHYVDAVGERAKGTAELARRDAIARAMNAWVDARYGRELLTLRKESRSGAEQLAQIAEARVRGGTAPPLESALARSVLGASRAGVLAAEGFIIQADGELRYATALSPDAAVQPVGDLAQTDDRDVDEEAAIELAQRAHPNVQVARAHAEAAQRSAEVYAAAGRPFIGFGLSYTREGGTGDRIIGGMVSMPLPFVNPNVMEATALQGEASVGRAQVVDIQSQVSREVRQAVHERYHARQVREELRVGAVIPGREALREIARRYEVGAVDLSVAIAARREVLIAEENYLAAAADVQRADIRLEHAVGGPIPRKMSR